MIIRNSEVLMTMRKCKLAILAIAVLLQVHMGGGYLFGQNSQNPQAPQAEAITPPITRQETLRGSITPERKWWDVLHYHPKKAGGSRQTAGGRRQMTVSNTRRREP